MTHHVVMFSGGLGSWATGVDGNPHRPRCVDCGDEWEGP